MWSKRVVRVAEPEPQVWVFAGSGRHWFSLFQTGFALWLATGHINRDGSATLWNILSMGFWATLALVGLWNLWRASLPVAISANGITVEPRQSGPLVTWDNIGGVAAADLDGQEVVLVGVLDAQRVLRGLPPRRQRTMQVLLDRVGTPVAIPLKGLPLTGEELVREIESFRPSAGGRPELAA